MISLIFAAISLIAIKFKSTKSFWNRLVLINLVCKLLVPLPTRILFISAWTSMNSKIMFVKWGKSSFKIHHKLFLLKPKSSTKVSNIISFLIMLWKLIKRPLPKLRFSFLLTLVSRKFLSKLKGFVIPLINVLIMKEFLHHARYRFRIPLLSVSINFWVQNVYWPMKKVLATRIPNVLL